MYHRIRGKAEIDLRPHPSQSFGRDDPGVCAVDQNLLHHDTIKQLYVKKKTFKWLLAIQLLTLGLLAWFSYELVNYGYFTTLYTNLKMLMNIK